MRTSLTLALTFSLVPATCFALDASDAMSSWKGASPQDKAKLVGDLMKKAGHNGGAGKVLECLDSASDIPGHSGLTIGRVADACMSSETLGDPV